MKNRVSSLIIFSFWVFVLLIIVVSGYWAWLSKHPVFSGYFGAGLGAFFTLVLVYVAWQQLSNISGTSGADFIHKLKNDFFKDETRILIHLIENKYIRYRDFQDERCEQGPDEDNNHNEKNGENEDGEKDKKESYFEVDSLKIDRCVQEEIGKRLKRWKFYSGYEIDDLLLGHFEDIGLFEQKRLIDIEMVYEEFSYYIKVSYENCAIKKYIKSLRKEDAGIYDKFEYIYKKCKSFEEAEERNKSFFIWKIKYRVYLWLGI